jgi:hypothetical protein
MTSMTFEELLHQSTDPVPTGQTLAVDADIMLEDSVLDAVNRHFLADESLVGLAVITPDGKTLGVIPLNTFLDYLEAQQNNATRVRGGGLDMLAGHAVSEVPFYRCDRHEPPYQRLSWDAQPICRTCGQPMKRAE